MGWQCGSLMTPVLLIHKANPKSRWRSLFSHRLSVRSSVTTLKIKQKWQWDGRVDHGWLVIFISSYRGLNEHLKLFPSGPWGRFFLRLSPGSGLVGPGCIWAQMKNAGHAHVQRGEATQVGDGVGRIHGQELAQQKNTLLIKTLSPSVSSKVKVNQS